MQFLVQMKIVAQGRATSPEARITLVENYIFPFGSRASLIGADI